MVHRFITAPVLDLNSNRDFIMDRIVHALKLLYSFNLSRLDFNLIGRAEDWKMVMLWCEGVSWLQLVMTAQRLEQPNLTRQPLAGPLMTKHNPKSIFVYSKLPELI